MNEEATKAAAQIALLLAALPEPQRQEALVLAMKVYIEGHMPRFEDVLRRKENGRR